MNDLAMVVNLLSDYGAVPRAYFSTRITDDDVVRAAIYFAALKDVGWVRTLTCHPTHGYTAKIAYYAKDGRLESKCAVNAGTARAALVGLAMFAGAWEGYERVIG